MIKNIIILIGLSFSIVNCSKKAPIDALPNTGIEQDTTDMETEVDPKAVIVEIARFPTEINECSGMINTGNKIISMNDGSNHTLLQEINPTNAEILETININQVSNIDWEAIQYQEDTIYIADIGNNEGDRENLRLYKIPYQLGVELTCIDTINFIWPDQTDFTTSNSHPFDCESMFIDGNVAVFFSKNRSDLKTNIYRLNLDTEVITKGETISIGGLATDVVQGPTGDLILLSYLTLNGSTFANKINILEESNEIYVLKNSILISQNTQIEAIVHLEDHKYLLGAESETNEGGYLYSLDLSEFYD